MVIVIGLVIIAAVIFMEQGQRRIPVQYARRMVGRKMYGGSSTYIPLKVNQAGIIPVIFASSLLYLPALATQFDPNGSQPGHQVHGQVPHHAVTTRSTWSIYFAMIVFFTYFYVSITFNPDEVADNMKKYGGFIPGIRAGKPTEEYLSYVLSRITLPGSDVPRSHRAHPAHRAGPGRREPELPVRRHLDPDHGGRRARHREADREPAPAAQLRRVPPLMRLILMGPPGAGKGTQAKVVADHFGIPAISTGDIFRANVAGKTELGREAQRYMDAGEYVPDEITNAMVRDRLASTTPSPGSCSTATRARSRRSTSSTACSPSSASSSTPRVPGRGPGRARRAAAAARRDRGAHRRHRRGDPSPPGDLRRADRPAHRGLRRARAARRGRRHGRRSTTVTRADLRRSRDAS